MNILKNTFSIPTLALFALLLCTAPLTAQDKQPRNDGKTVENLQQKKTTTPEEIQTQKIAFFTQELELTPKEAEKFWPLYNEFWDMRGQARKQTITALKELNKALKAEPAKSDSEIKRLSEIYLANYVAEGELLSEYFVKIQKTIPIKKAARIFYAEEKFRHILIKQLRGNNHK